MYSSKRHQNKEKKHPNIIEDEDINKPISEEKKCQMLNDENMH